jgi:hypothetical protein
MSRQRLLPAIARPSVTAGEYDIASMVDPSGSSDTRLDAGLSSDARQSVLAADPAICKLEAGV